ncbi:DUF2066 domain-containing protein, partial [Kaarinaea lacus]
MKKSICFLIVFLSLLASPAQAAIVEGLYEAQVLVSSQNRTERDKAMRTGLAEVFAKVSGRSDAPELPGIKQALEKPALLVQQFLYRSLEEANISASHLGANAQVVWFRFDENAVNRVLRQNNLAVWGRTRPATLVWLAIEQDGSRYLIGSGTDDQIRDYLEIEAQRRGMALLLPLLDLQDQTAIRFADVWGDFQDSILAASSRYQAEAILVGRIGLSSSDVWHSRWTLYEAGQNKRWEMQAPYVDEALQAGVLGTVDSLALRYAQVYSDDNPDVVHLAVLDISKLQDFARVSDYLKSLEQVKDIKPVRVTENSVRFRLNIRGNPDGLNQTISLGNVLRKEQVVIE